MVDVVNKSSIGFLLSGTSNNVGTDASTAAPTSSPATKKDEHVLIESKMVSKQGGRSVRRIRKIHRPQDPQLSLELVQQPSHAKVTPPMPTRVFPPFAEHRPIHPPPVLQLRVGGFLPKGNCSYDTVLNDTFLNGLANSDDPKSVERVDELRVIRDLSRHKVPSWTHYSTFFVIARLRSDDEQDISHLFRTHQQNDKSLEDLLIGTKVSSGMSIPLKLASPANSFLRKALPQESIRSTDFATTFVFSDLSVKKVGRFKLKFDLFEVTGGRIHKRSEITSREFQVFTPKKFPGSTPSTPLTAFLFKQGARIRQRKRPVQKRSSTTSTSTQSEESSAREQHYKHRKLAPAIAQLPSPSPISTSNQVLAMSHAPSVIKIQDALPQHYQNRHRHPPPHQPPHLHDHSQYQYGSQPPGMMNHHLSQISEPQNRLHQIPHELLKLPMTATSTIPVQYQPQVPPLSALPRIPDHLQPVTQPRPQYSYNELTPLIQFQQLPLPQLPQSPVYPPPNTNPLNRDISK